MDVEQLIGTMMQGALIGGGKRSHRTQRFLFGGGNTFLNASTLLTVGGLIWGAVETMQQQGGVSSTPPAQQAGPSPLPGGSSLGAPAAVPPPIPGTASTVPAPPAAGGVDAVPEGAAKIVRLMISAARADGTFTDSERAAVLDHARTAGAEALVGRELQQPTPLAAIVEGIADDRQREDLYVLAYSIVRADETVSGAEQIYLAQLASLLGFDAPTVERLEAEAAGRIAAEGGQP